MTQSLKELTLAAIAMLSEMGLEAEKLLLGD
jgi:hypothetical protein